MFSIWTVALKKGALKSLDRAPIMIQERFEKWREIVELKGPRGLENVRGFRDHSLKGEWQGARASRLNDQWRVIYYVFNDEIRILVMEVTPHDYRKKG